MLLRNLKTLKKFPSGEDVEEPAPREATLFYTANNHLTAWTNQNMSEKNIKLKHKAPPTEDVADIDARSYCFIYHFVFYQKYSLKMCSVDEICDQIENGFSNISLKPNFPLLEKPRLSPFAVSTFQTFGKSLLNYGYKFFFTIPH
jgi:hypothetical protein